MIIEYPSADSLIYPLVDGDNSSAVLREEDAMEFVGVAGDYGNLYWSNAEGTTAISWRGSPHRYYRVPDTVNIPSLSRYFSGRPMMTVFSNLVYKDGSVLAATTYSSPKASYIMGASYPSSLIVVAMEDTESSFDTVVWVTGTPDPNPDLCKWVEIFRQNTGRTELPYFPDVSGLFFTSGTGATITISEDLKQASYTPPLKTNNLASMDVTIRTGGRRFPTILDVMYLKFNGSEVQFKGTYYWESMDITQAYSGKEFFDNRTECTLTMTSKSTSPPKPQSASVDYFETTAKLLSPGDLVVSGPSVWINGLESNYSYYHGIGNVTWKFPTDDCTSGTVSVNDSCGRSASLSVSGGGGHWTATDPDTSSSPVGWSVGEWHYSGSKRTRLVTYTPNARTCYIDGLARCPHTNTGWDGDTYYEVVGSPGTTYGSCTGGPPTAIWWNGNCVNTWFYEQQCPGTTPCGAPFAYQYIAGSAVNCPPTGDGLVTLAEMFYRAWSKFSRQQNADAYTIESQEWVCP